jgi:thioredoxin-related protein
MIAQAEKSVVLESAWLTNYDAALVKAQNENKNVLVFFTGSDWCAPCKMLKKDLFETTAFQDISNDYVMLYIDIPMNRDLISAEQLRHNKEVSSRLNRKGSVPLMTILNEKGKELETYSGYSMNGEVKFHIELLKKYQ